MRLWIWKQGQLINEGMEAWLLGVERRSRAMCWKDSAVLSKAFILLGDTIFLFESSSLRCIIVISSTATRLSG
jgi:hypothetical protein